MKSSTLGILLILRKNKNLRFEFLINKIQNKIGTWKTLRLSQGGRSMLIKYVSFKIPIYNMSVLKLPEKMIGSIDKTQRRFWWGDVEGKRKKENAYNQKDICKPTDQRGLGIRDTKCNNMAL